MRRCIAIHFDIISIQTFNVKKKYLQRSDDENKFFSALKQVFYKKGSFCISSCNLATKCGTSILSVQHISSTSKWNFTVRSSSVKILIHGIHLILGLPTSVILCRARRLLQA